MNQNMLVENYQDLYEMTGEMLNIILWSKTWI